MSTPTFYINCRNQGADLTIEQVDQLRNDWFDMFPEMNTYKFPELDRVVDASQYEKSSAKAWKKAFENEEGEYQELEEDELGMQESEMVQRYRACNLVGIWRADCSKQMALNFPFQSLAAVVSKVALWNVFLLSWRDNYKIVCFIHDEIIVEVEEERLHEVAMDIQEAMVAAGKQIMPDMLLTAEPAAMRRWCKAAEPVFNEDGRLIPFEDANN